jgi:hypothetical protein
MKLYQWRWRALRTTNPQEINNKRKERDVIEMRWLLYIELLTKEGFELRNKERV